jgi:hypothetical protein
MIKAEEQALVEKLVAHAPVETFSEAVLHLLFRRYEMPDDPVVLRPAFEVNSVSLSEAIMRGLPRRSISAVNSRATGRLRSRCLGSPPGIFASRRQRW